MTGLLTLAAVAVAIIAGLAYTLRYEPTDVRSGGWGAWLRSC